MPLPRVPEEEALLGGEDHGPHQARPRPEERLAEGQRDDEGREPAQDRGEPGRHLVEQLLQLGHGRGGPEVERRLVRVEVAEQVGHQPRPPAHHLARGQRVLRLQRVAQDLAPE